MLQLDGVKQEAIAYRLSQPTYFMVDRLLLFGEANWLGCRLIDSGTENARWTKCSHDCPAAIKRSGTKFPPSLGYFTFEPSDVKTVI